MPKSEKQSSSSGITCATSNPPKRGAHSGSQFPGRPLWTQKVESLESWGWREGRPGEPKPEQASIFWSPEVQEALPSREPRLQIHRLLECIPLSLQLPPLTADLSLGQHYTHWDPQTHALCCPGPALAPKGRVWGLHFIIGKLRTTVWKGFCPHFSVSYSPYNQGPSDLNL